MSNEKDDYYGFGYAVMEMAPEIIIGKTMSLIEILGLDEKQETSLKENIKQIIRIEFTSPRAVALSAETYTGLRLKMEKQDKESIEKGVLTGEYV